MNKEGHIIVIEDDEDDQAIFNKVFTELNLPNKVIYFGDGEAALNYLIGTPEHPFLILCDINLPKLNGIQLREQIQQNEQLSLKCIPYLFFTTTADQQSVIDAYSKSIQGFFTKPDNYAGLLDTIKKIIDYWQICHSPNL